MVKVILRSIKLLLETNFISALAQCEAAVEIFRAQNSSHLVMISSMSAMRGMPKHLTAYGASKAGVAHLAEGIRAELIDTPIKVTTIFPGYIRTEINEGAKNYHLKWMRKRVHVYWQKKLRKRQSKPMYRNGLGCHSVWQ